MLKRFAFTAVLALGALGSTVASAQTVQNGNFVGARYATGSIGTTVPTPFGVGSSSYFLSDFAWSGTGSGALNGIASSGSQVPGLFAPSNPTGYTGNIYYADADPLYSKGVFLLQTLTNLTVGTSYTLNFQQASGSFYTGGGETARWDVGFGGSVAFNGASWVLSGADHQFSTLMTNGIGTGISPWTNQSLTFTAKSTSELLSFMATGTGAPPFALLANVSISGAAPEPGTWLMMIVGFGLAGVAIRRAKVSARGTVVTA